MRIFRKIVGLGIFFLVNTACFAGLPFHPQAVGSLNSEQVPTKGHTRLRIAVSNGDLKFDGQVRIGAISVCSKSACYRPAIKSNVDLYDTSAGTSESVAEMEVPYTEIISVHFASVAGQKAAIGDIALTTPLKLEDGFEGGEIFIVLRKYSNKDGVVYYPTASAVGLLRSSGSSVYYNPKIGTIAELKYGSTLSIPAGATSSLQIFNIALHDTGEAHPLIDIFPVVKLAIPASITFSEMLRTNDKDVEQGRPKTATSPKITKPLTDTGVIRPNSKETISINSSTRTELTASATTGDCIAKLSASINKQAIYNNIGATGVVYLNWCENSPPYVHVAVMNLHDSRIFLRLLYQPPQVYNNRFPALPLTRITTWSNSFASQVLINGFSWEGDYGITSGGYGFANGFVESSWVTLGYNLIGGGYGQGNQSAAGNKFAILTQPGLPPNWKEAAVSPLWPEVFPSGSWTIASSSTSIVKYGFCATDSLISGWSAMGTTQDMRMVFVSTVSGGTTSAAELCPVLKALDVYNAIRMDGGPSTGMTVDGILKNPLTGLDSFKYGTSRHIAYALAIGNAPGKTPAPIASTRVTPPPNPCIINPLACAR